MAVEQGSPEWHAMRVGKATASRIADIVRTTRSGSSKTRERYLGELVAERMTGVPAARFQSDDMRWGSATEPEAAAAYAYYHGGDLQAVDFVDHPTLAMSGASPDRLVGAEGLLEIKCPATHTHIAMLRGAPIDSDYLVQMQWQMACTGRLWCDFASYDPRMPEDMRLHVRRVPRETARICALEKEVRAFLDEVDAAVADLIAKYRQQQQAAE